MRANVLSADVAGTRVPHAGSPGPSPRFSVIVNVYNGEAFLRETIDSVLAQSFTDFELIFWDDCSTDGSPDICAGYVDPRFRYFRAAARVSVAAARARAVTEAKGEWLAFLDQDDIWLPHKLAAQNAVIEQDMTGRVALVYGRTLRFDLRGRLSAFDPWHSHKRLPEGDIFAELLRRPSFIALSSASIRRTAFIDACGTPAYVNYCPDYYYCVAISRRYLAACVQEPCCLYRVHQSNMSQLYRRQIHEEALRIIEAAAEWPAQRRILRTRRRVHQTWIGVEEIRTRDAVGSGIRRILLKGSLTYLTFRPLLVLARRLRGGVPGRR
jgi:glycosyltransferase involved in cell wall biosynthesis